jgi:hypothetical protein
MRDAEMVNAIVERRQIEDTRRLRVVPAGEAGLQCPRAHQPGTEFQPLCRPRGWYDEVPGEIRPPTKAAPGLALVTADNRVVALGSVEPGSMPGEGTLTVVALPRWRAEALGGELLPSLRELARKEAYCELTTAVSCQEAVSALKAAGMHVRCSLSFAGTTELRLWVD